MATTLVTSYGGKDSNCYVSVTQASSIVHAHALNSTIWDNSGDDIRTRALIIATNNIDALRWHGSKYFFDQARAFPRVPPGQETPLGVVGRPETAYTQLLEDDLYQKRQKSRVETATALQALYLLRLEQEGVEQRHRKLQRQGVTSWSRSVGGSVSESFSYARNELLGPEAWEQLYHYKGTTRIVRGDSQSYEFE